MVGSERLRLPGFPTPDRRRPEPKKGKERPVPLTVIYAGESRRRREFLLYAFPEAASFSFPGGEEPDVPDVYAIAKGKIRFANAFMPDMTVDRQTRRQIVIVAADTRTSTLAPNKTGTSAELKSRGKPRNPQEVLRTFHAMHEASVQFDTPPFYQAVSGSISEIKSPRGYQKNGQLATTTVELDPDFVERLCSDSGFTIYQQVWDDFYSSPPYSAVGHTNVHMSDISAGISLPVLAKLGAIVAIDNTSIQDERYPDILKRAIFNVAVSFHPAVLKPILPNIEEIIDHWPWLNKVTQSALNRPLQK